MSEPQQPPKSSGLQERRYTIYFMIALSFACALILAILASGLQEPQQLAKDLDRSRQMLIAARIINPLGYFQIKDQNGEYIPAIYENEYLVPSQEITAASSQGILDIYRTRVEPMLVNDKGEETTFEKAGINEDDYVKDYLKTGYGAQPWKLVYKIYTPPVKDQEKKIDGYVIPVNGMGLWNVLYGYIAIKPDGNTVIGISWYQQGETPGLGGNIVEPYWIDQFHDKRIFQANSSGKNDLSVDPIGIVVVKGKVNDVLGNSPKAASAVDGMAGATLTGNGVTDAYKNSLTPYRAFFLRLNKENGGN